jgi:hypothetical protein
MKRRPETVLYTLNVALKIASESGSVGRPGPVCSGVETPLALRVSHKGFTEPSFPGRHSGHAPPVDESLWKTRYDLRLELWTPEFERRYLCGRDDIHLFIAQVRTGDTVAQAHQSLKPDLVRQAEAAQPGTVRRQGEWFFVLPSVEESERLHAHIKMWPRAVKLRAPIGEGGRAARRRRSRHNRSARPIETS